MTAIFEYILSFLRSLRCFVILRPDEAGVRLLCGRVTKLLGPGGLHWCIPIIGDFGKMSVVEQVANVPEQSLTTSDGASIAVGLKISYTVTNVAKALYRVFDLDQAIQTEATGCVASAVCDRTWVNCIEEREEIEDEIRQTLQASAGNWGVKVQSLRFNDLAKSRCFRVLGVK